MPRLTIIIVTYNSRDEIDACLDSLSRYPPATNHDVVVVDNASPDGTASAIRARWPRVRVIDAGGNHGFAAANNIGFRHTAGELVLLLNPDTRVPQGAVDTLVRILDADAGVAIVGPRLVDSRGGAELSFGAMISPLAELRQKALVRGNDRGVPIVRSVVERLTGVSKDVDWVSGACLLVRRADAEAAGLMDERYFMYVEDVDFCAAIRARGRRIRFAADATVVHARGRSVASAPERITAAYRHSQLAFYEKHHPGWVPFLRYYLKVTGRLPDTPIK